MTTETYELIPGSVASLLYVRPPGLTGNSIPCVFMSNERGIVVGRFEKPLAAYGWPLDVQAHINRYFARVFSLEHENWTNVGPSPRARYVDSAKPWSVTVTEEPS